MGKSVTAQLPVPHESTVALLRKLGGKEGPGPHRPPTHALRHRSVAGSALTLARDARQPITGLQPLIP